MIKLLRRNWLFCLILLVAILVRIIGLNAVPPELYWEEVALGYDAYSVSQTGADHHGNAWPILAFESFGDWKPSLYFYVAAPFTAVFGLNAWGVRLPSAFAGIAIAIGIYVMARQLFKNKTIALAAMAFATLSPWAIQFSRGGWEVNLATALILWGVVCLIKSIDSINLKKPTSRFSVNWWIINGLILLVLSMYAYHAARIIAPLLGAFLFVIWFWPQRKNWLHQLPTLIISAILAVLLLMPFITNLSNPQLMTRFGQTNIFSQIETIEQSNQCNLAGGQTLFSKIYCHRYLFFGREILLNYLSYLSPTFLFLHGDSNLRHSTGLMGIFYATDVLLLIFGLIYLFTAPNKALRPWVKFLLGFWLIIGLLPATLSLGNPHALRVLPTLPVWLMVIGCGVKFLNDWWQKTKLWPPAMLIVICAALLAQFSLWVYHYVNIYPKTSQEFWQVGYQQLMKDLRKQIRGLNLDAQTTLYITREQGRPAMYYFFYQQIDPRLVQTQNQTAKQDQSEFLEFNDQGRIIKFVNGLGEVDLTKPALIAATPAALAEFNTQLSEEGNNPSQNLSTSQANIWQINYYQPN